MSTPKTKLAHIELNEHTKNQARSHRLMQYALLIWRLTYLPLRECSLNT